MRFHCLLVFCCLQVVSLPSFLLAQFQDPTEDELRMCVDLKAQGAAAVYLNAVEETDDLLPQDLHAFCQNVDANRQEQIVLSIGAEQKGN